MVDSERIQNQWMTSVMDSKGSFVLKKTSSEDDKLGVGERAFSAAGAAFLSAIIVNPLDVAKVTLSMLFLFLFSSILIIVTRRWL